MPATSPLAMYLSMTAVIRSSRSADMPDVPEDARDSWLMAEPPAAAASPNAITTNAVKRTETTPLVGTLSVTCHVLPVLFRASILGEGRRKSRTERAPVVGKLDDGDGGRVRSAGWRLFDAAGNRNPRRRPPNEGLWFSSGRMNSLLRAAAGLSSRMEGVTTVLMRTI